MNNIKLTSYSSGAGWACKINPKDLINPVISPENLFTAGIILEDNNINKARVDVISCAVFSDKTMCNVILDCCDALHDQVKEYGWKSLIIQPDVTYQRRWLESGERYDQPQLINS